MIKSFRHKGLHLFFQKGDGSKIAADQIERIRERLSALNSASDLRELNLPGFNLHSLRGKPQRHTIHVNGPWAITFQWKKGEAWLVDLENYHERK